jgi:SnoaL-like domain
MKMNRILAGSLPLLVLALACAPLFAADDVDSLARDVERLTSLRQVKDVQRSYAQYQQYGLWDEMATLFTANATFIRGAQTLVGRDAIEAFLLKNGGGKRGIASGALDTEFIDEPLVNLSMDGRSAKARWMSLAFLGDGKGGTRIKGGIYENEYIREETGWKISVAHYYPQFDGDHATGWTNIGGADLPLVPFHFSIEESGVPVPQPTGTAPHSSQPLAAVMQQVNRLNDEDAVRNLQSAYGYYVDRKMWDDVTDLFADDAIVEVGGVGMLLGRKGVRSVMERMGAAGLQHGQLNDRPQFDTIVQVMPGGREAISRGIELGMVGEADKGTARWEITVFRNRFLKENGLWKLKELRLYPVMRADYAAGWGSGGLARFDNKSLPAFAGNNPATGKPVNTSGFQLEAAQPRTGKIGAILPTPTSRTEAELLAEARRKLARSVAWDGTENVSSAYGYYIDDFQWPQMAGIFAVKGNKQSPFTGYYMGRERIMGAVNATWGPSAPTRPGISYHWRTQLVINVAEDGRSANLRTRLFQPRTGKEVGKAGDFYGAMFFGGMYPNDQAVLENGVWKLWSLEIDEPYFSTAGWKGGWSGVKPVPPPAPGYKAPPTALATKFPPDIPMDQLGKRAEHFRGGTGQTIEWPGILPMWFNYRNPVSGRVPELYMPDCVPCEVMPESQMTRHGYLMPPTGP